MFSNFKTKVWSPPPNKIQSEEFAHENLLPCCIRVKVYFNVSLCAFDKANSFITHGTMGAISFILL